MANKISFETLDAAVEKIYSTISLDDIDPKCELIEAVIISSGWTLDEYWQMAIQRYCQPEGN